MTKRRAVWFFIFCALLLQGCISAHTERMSAVDPAGWEPGETVEVVFPNTDTISKRTLSIVLLVDKRYINDPLQLDISVTSPDSIECADSFTVDYEPVSAANRKRTEITVPYQRSAVLGQKGDYVYRFATHLPVIGVLSIGIKSENE